MVRRAATLVLFALLIHSLPAQPSTPLTGYQIGDRATRDILAPVPLMVVDQAATQVLRDQAAAQVPPFYCCYPVESEEAVSEFKTAFNNTRFAFLEARRADKIRGADTNGPLTGAAVMAFRAQNNGFPADDKWLARWLADQGDQTPAAFPKTVGQMVNQLSIAGQADDAEEALAGRIRKAMARHIRTENLPAAFKLGDLARLLTITDPLEIPKLDAAEQQAQEVSAQADFENLAQARAELVASFPAQEKAVAQFVAGFLRENTEPDAALTRASRDRATAALLSADNYDAGSFIVKRGQVITARIKAALDQLNDKLLADARVTQLQQQAAQNQTLAMVASERNRWLIGTLLAVTVTGGLIIRWQVRRWNRKRRGKSLAVRVLSHEGVMVSCPTCAEHIVVPMDLENSAPLPACGHGTHEDWRRRAVAAEQRAKKSADVARDGMMSYLAKYLSTEFVKKLASQRGELIESQRRAAARVEELAARLENLETPAQNEQFYQQRITELEQQLAESNELNRSLIKLKIVTARQQLDQARVRVTLN